MSSIQAVLRLCILLHTLLLWPFASRSHYREIARWVCALLVSSRPLCDMLLSSHGHLHDALQVSKGRIPLIQMLLQAGAKVNAKDSTGSTPLHRCAISTPNVHLCAVIATGSCSHVCQLQRILCASTIAPACSFPDALAYAAEGKSPHAGHVVLADWTQPAPLSRGAGQSWRVRTPVVPLPWVSLQVVGTRLSPSTSFQKGLILR